MLCAGSILNSSRDNHVSSVVIFVESWGLRWLSVMRDSRTYKWSRRPYGDSLNFLAIYLTFSLSWYSIRATRVLSLRFCTFWVRRLQHLLWIINLILSLLIWWQFHCNIRVSFGFSTFRKEFVGCLSALFWRDLESSTWLLFGESSLSPCSIAYDPQ